MKFDYDIEDDEIRFIGEKAEAKNEPAKEYTLPASQSPQILEMEEDVDDFGEDEVFTMNLDSKQMSINECKQMPMDKCKQILMDECKLMPMDECPKTANMSSTDKDGDNNGKGNNNNGGCRRKMRITIIILVLIIVGITLIKNCKKDSKSESTPYFENVETVETPKKDIPVLFDDNVAGESRVNVLDTIINDVGLRIYKPVQAHASLLLGNLPFEDESIIYIAQAADIRADNKKILGAFVLEGEPLAWGMSKKGYCAIINNNISVGVSDNSPLFEEATEKGGYFFRQYPLVNNGVLCENEPKNKSYRRSICQRQGETFMVHSTDKESFHDFTQALVDLGVDNAVYLVGSEAYGWAILPDGTKEIWGLVNHNQPQTTSYIVFRK
ncbi:MAG: hypothetical protein HUJ95_01760 [Bacteroidales bacterium]|nr:hypothetical protein [Bacteroidales bacterium]